MAEAVANIPKATLLAYVRGLLNDPNSLSYSDTEINNWIDYASADASKITRLVETEKFIKLATGVSEYTNPLNEALSGPFPAKSAMGILSATYLGNGSTWVTQGDVTISVAYNGDASPTAITPTATTYNVMGLETELQAKIDASEIGASKVKVAYLPQEAKYIFYNVTAGYPAYLVEITPAGTNTLESFIGVTATATGKNYVKSNVLIATNAGLDRSSSMSLIAINPKQVKNAMDTTASKPQYYFEYGDKIGIYPSPSSTYNGHIVSIKGWQSISDYSYYINTVTATEDSWYLPYKLSPVIIFKVLSYAKLKYNKYDQSAQYENIFNALSVFARQDLSDRKFDSKYDVMKIADNTVIQQ